MRSSRQIERRCHEDVAFQVLACNATPDHVTIANLTIVRNAPELLIPPARHGRQGKLSASRSDGLRAAPRPWRLHRGTGEWKLLCGNRNLLKLWRHQTAGPLATPTTT